MTYPAETRDRICELIAEGKSVREICRMEGMPAMSAVFRWLSEDKAFQEQYTRAREAQADTLFEEMLEIADDARNDWMERNAPDGGSGWQFNGEHVQRSKLRLEARKWMAGKLRPKVYGEKAEITHEAGESVKEIVRTIIRAA